MSRLVVCLFVLAAIMAPFTAIAESNYKTGNASPLTATAHLDFVVVVPKILYLRVGTGNNMASQGTVNLVSFAVPASSMGNGVPIAATAGSGDLGNGVVTARVIGNNGNITLSATTAGALGNGAGDTLDYNQITTSSALLSSASALPAPALSSGASNSTTVAAVANVVNRDARWTYTYDNSVLLAPGTYGGVNSNNGRVTYTASMP